MVAQCSLVVLVSTEKFQAREGLSLPGEWLVRTPASGGHSLPAERDGSRALKYMSDLIHIPGWRTLSRALAGT